MTMPHKLIQQASPRHPPVFSEPGTSRVIKVAAQVLVVDWTREVPSQPSQAQRNK
jgi:hypothetical protein